jgi:hypothetical protein
MVVLAQSVELLGLLAGWVLRHPLLVRPLDTAVVAARVPTGALLVLGLMAVVPDQTGTVAAVAEVQLTAAVAAVAAVVTLAVPLRAGLVVLGSSLSVSRLRSHLLRSSA